MKWLKLPAGNGIRSKDKRWSIRQTRQGVWLLTCHSNGKNVVVGRYNSQEAALNYLGE